MRVDPIEVGVAILAISAGVAAVPASARQDVGLTEVVAAVTSIHHLHERLFAALRRGDASGVRAVLMPGGDLCLFVANGRSKPLTIDDAEGIGRWARSWGGGDDHGQAWTMVSCKTLLEDQALAIVALELASHGEGSHDFDGPRRRLRVRSVVHKRPAATGDEFTAVDGDFRGEMRIGHLHMSEGPDAH